MHTVETKHAPAAIGPYAQAQVLGNMVYTSGQVALDPQTGQMVAGPVSAQINQVLKNLDAILKAAGTNRNHVVKTTIFLADLNDFAEVNAHYASFFGSHRPARSTVEVARLPLDALVEIECIATLS